VNFRKLPYINVFKTLKRKESRELIMEMGECVIKPRHDYGYKPDPKILYDVIVVGGGIVGFASAMYAGRLGLNTLIIGEQFGGNINLPYVVENYPGYIAIGGRLLAKRVEDHAKDYDIDILNDKVIKIETGKNFKVYTSDKTFSSKTIIYATGTTLKHLNVPGEKEFENKGVSYCALCEGPLFKNKVVGVVGGGDSAVKEAILLTQYAKKVFMIVRSDKLKAEPTNVDHLEEYVKKGHVEILYETNVKEIKGDKLVTHVVLDKPHKGKKELEISGLFIYIGHIPQNSLAKEIGIKLNEKGEIIINRNSETNIPGFYAAGDVADTKFKQAITGVAEGVHAAYNAYEHITHCCINGKS